MNSVMISDLSTHFKFNKQQYGTKSGKDHTIIGQKSTLHAFQLSMCARF